MNIREKLGFDKILEKLENYIAGPGKTLLERIHFSTDYELINKQLTQTSEFVEIIHNHQFPDDHYIDLRPTLNKIRLSDSFPEPQEVLKLWLSLETIQKIKKFFTANGSGKFPELRKLASQIKIYKYVFERIKQTVNRKGEVPDPASKELKNIRQSLRDKQLELTKTVNTIFKQAQSQGLIEADASPVMREGKLLIPVRAAKKYQIQGIVRDSSATGKTVYIEPLKSVELSNDLIELKLSDAGK